MTYVELLRASRAVRVYAAVVAGLTLLAVVAALQSRDVIVVSGAVHAIPPRSLVTIAVYLAFPLAIILGNTLNRENATLAIAWTRPVRRERLALRYAAVDVVALIAIVALTFAAILAICAAAGLVPSLGDPAGTASAAIAGLGMVVMWYGLLQAATAALDAGRAGAIRGLSVPFFLVLSVLYGLRLPPALHALVAAANVLNPFAWYSGSSDREVGVHLGIATRSVAGQHVNRFFTAVPEPVAIWMPWLLGALALALAIRLWSRHQVTR